MAEVADLFPERGVLDKYLPWFDGQIWKLKRGVDFDMETLRFDQSMRQAARNHGIAVRIACRPPDIVYVQALAGGTDRRYKTLRVPTK